MNPVKKVFKEVLKEIWSSWVGKLIMGVCCFDAVALPIIAVVDPEYYNMMMTTIIEVYTNPTPFTARCFLVAFAIGLVVVAWQLRKDEKEQKKEEAE